MGRDGFDEGGRKTTIDKSPVRGFASIVDRFECAAGVHLWPALPVGYLTLHRCERCGEVCGCVHCQTLAEGRPDDLPYSECVRGYDLTSATISREEPA